MASIVFSAAGAAIGSSIPVVGPVIGSAVGRALGASLGGVVDNAIFGTPTRHVEGPRLEDLAVQVSTYGKPIPIIYGHMRLAGNVIWSLPIQETATTTTSSSGGGKGGGGGGTRVSRTNYSYSVSLAIALCEGEIEGIVRAWADAKLLDLSQGVYRVHHGTDDQLPDPLIEAEEGVGSTPAYRGLAYVVIEDFPLGEFGNRIPNFTFEVKRPVAGQDYQGQSTEEMITGMTIIPGAGEFVYDTVEQTKIEGIATGAGFARTSYETTINRHTPSEDTNAIVSLDQLQQTCPNLEWISLIVTWFGDSLDAGSCTIRPGVEFQGSATTEPDSWSVAGLGRDQARQITLINGTPRYGGTPSDASVLRYMAEIKSRGLKVMLYPMFFMDIDGKPWRGRVTGSATDVASLFTKADGLNAFISHYANLGAGEADAFVIGSELIGLTSVSDAPGSYPAVDELVNLAANVKGVMGGSTLVTYAADWSEYHHTDGGWYHLDPLWSSTHIDMIGIDAYFPLSDAPQTELGYDVEAIKQGWDSGEGYDFIYTDDSRTTKQAISPEFAWKDLDWFWNNTHTNPDGNQTSWVPQSKPIWFTEYGFPSVDGTTNQPNVFYDPDSVESFFPHFSKGVVDFAAQRTGITATEARWSGSSMVTRLFLWTWDARPFPYFPDLQQVWNDGPVWAPGHWVTGKLGVSGLASIVKDICLRCGLSESQIDVSRLSEQVQGYVIASQQAGRSLIEQLMSAYFFDAVESGEWLSFIPRGGVSQATISEEELVREEERGNTRLTVRQQEVELPQAADVLFLDRSRDYQTESRRASRQLTQSQRRQRISLPLVLGAQQALEIAQRHLYLQWLERLSYQVTLPLSQAVLEPADLITITSEQRSQTLRITHVLQDQGQLRVEAVAEDITLYEPVGGGDERDSTAQPVPRIPQTRLSLLDIPALPEDEPQQAGWRVAAIGAGAEWRGAALYRAGTDGEYQRIGEIGEAATLGMVSVPPGAFAGNIMDYASTLEVVIEGGGELASVSRLALLGGANAALVGGEVLQFQTVEALGSGTYRLRDLLRGRLGTEHQTGAHSSGESFVLLNGALMHQPVPPALFDTSRHYKAVSLGGSLGSTQPVAASYHATALQPYCPAHLQASGEAGADIILRWVRRDRLYGQWRDKVDIGLAETSERYRVAIDRGNTQLRTAETSSPTFVYSLAMQGEDGVSAGETLNIQVAQLSSLVGPGDSAVITV